MITTKGRNALQIMLDLAQNEEDGYVSLSDVAARLNKSNKYLEAVMPQLISAGLVLSARGKEGGYRLAKPAEECTVAEIITATEGSLAPVSCLSGDTPCEKADGCLSQPLWRELDEVIMNFLKSKTVAELLKK